MVREDQRRFFGEMSGHDLFYGEYSTSLAYISFYYSPDILDDIRDYVLEKASSSQVQRLADRFSVSSTLSDEFAGLFYRFLPLYARTHIQAFARRVAVSVGKGNEASNNNDPSFTLLLNLRATPPPVAGGTLPPLRITQPPITVHAALLAAATRNESGSTPLPASASLGLPQSVTPAPKNDRTSPEKMEMAFYFEDHKIYLTDPKLIDDAINELDAISHGRFPRFYPPSFIDSGLSYRLIFILNKLITIIKTTPDKISPDQLEKIKQSLVILEPRTRNVTLIPLQNKMLQLSQAIKNNMPADLGEKSPSRAGTPPTTAGGGALGEEDAVGYVYDSKAGRHVRSFHGATFRGSGHLTHRASLAARASLATMPVTAMSVGAQLAAIESAVVLRI